MAKKTTLPFLCSLLLFCFSCKEKKNNPAEITASPGVAKDSDSNPGLEDKTIYIERARLDLKDYSAVIKTQFTLPVTLSEDSSYYFEHNFLIVTSKRNNHSDTLEMESDYYDPTDLVIENMTDSLHFKSLCLGIDWRGDSDMEWTQFAGYSGDSLKSYFTVNSLQSLRRKDEWTLSGFVASRDELVSNFQMDYPITVSLKDYSVSQEDPPVQYIGYSSSVLEPIKGYKMVGAKDSIPYTIKKGTAVEVDTLYRAAKMVRLIINGKTIIHVKLKEAKGKLQENAAG